MRYKTLQEKKPKHHVFVDRLTAEFAVPPFYGDTISSTHVSVAFYGLAESHDFTSSGTHVEHAALKEWLRWHDLVALLKDT